MRTWTILDLTGPIYGNIQTYPALYSTCRGGSRSLRGLFGHLFGTLTSFVKDSESKTEV